MNDNLSVIGLGIGNPNLISIKGYNEILNSKIIVYPIYNNYYSISKFILKSYNIIKIEMPLFLYYIQNKVIFNYWLICIIILLELKYNLSFLNLGNPNFYGSYLSIIKCLSSYYKINIIKGISSIKINNIIEINKINIVFSNIKDIKSIYSFILYSSITIFIKINKFLIKFLKLCNNLNFKKFKRIKFFSSKLEKINYIINKKKYIYYSFIFM